VLGYGLWSSGGFPEGILPGDPVTGCALDSVIVATCGAACTASAKRPEACRNEMCMVKKSIEKLFPAI